MGRRTKAEMLALDQKIRPLYERGLGCRVIGDALDENPVTILKRVRRMGIVRAKDHPSPIPGGDVPFTREPDNTELRRSAIGVAVRWFLDRGYMVSIPVDPTRYDLVVESDEGLQRVQVKTTTQQAQQNTHWIVGIYRSVYNGKAPVNAGGKRTRVAYTKEDIDLFFVVTGDRDTYLIPLETTGNRLSVTLDHRFDRYKF